MTIERDSLFRVHNLGALQSFTRWITLHEAGLAEWMKNVRRMYQQDRANVDEGYRVATILLRDGNLLDADPANVVTARIGLLDVGGASLGDLERWSVWQDPDASNPSQVKDEEETQGNGGKAYMYRMFRGPARFLGVRDGLKNCKGLEGPKDSLERGTPGFVPDATSGREAPAAGWKEELNAALQPYGITFDSLPAPMKAALRARKAFTLVEGVDPIDISRLGIIPTDLPFRVVRFDQALVALEQVAFFAIHNGAIVNDGKPLALEPVDPHPGFETARNVSIPVELDGPVGQVNTTGDGKHPAGRLSLFTSRGNMAAASAKYLRARWRMVYRTGRHTMAGVKAIAELAPAVPGSQYVYGELELAALAPDYVGLGRARPLDGPLMAALDHWIGEQIKALAHEISEKRKVAIDAQALDEVHKQNRRLDEWKNKFLPTEMTGAGAGGSGQGDGPGVRIKKQGTVFGTKGERIEIEHAGETLLCGRGVDLNLGPLLEPVLRDDQDRPVKAKLKWISSAPHILEVTDADKGHVVARQKGRASIHVEALGLKSLTVDFDVWIVDHVLLTPRSLLLNVGATKRIQAEVTSDDGQRSSEVLLNWQHTAEDPLLVRVNPYGWATGNRIGKTTILAGVGPPDAGGVWSRIGVETEVQVNPNPPGKGSGLPQLLVTGKDIDPSTHMVREGDPDQPALWQDPVDFIHNVWWLNLQSPEAQVAFALHQANPTLWRLFHAQKVVEMMVQVHMKGEYTERGEQERPLFWGEHKNSLDNATVRVAGGMWDGLRGFITEGADPV